MTRHEERDRLRRIIYGPDSSAAQRTEAEHALLLLDQQEQHGREREEAAAQAALDDESGVAENKVEESATDEDVERDATTFWQRRINLGWLIPIVVGSLLLGAAVAAGVNWSLLNSSPTAAKGDLAAADAWFDSPTSPEDEDSLPVFEAQSYDIDVRDLRRTEVPGVWVGRTDAFLCLVIQQWEGSGATCVERADFARDGIDYAVGNLHIRWYGHGVVVRESTQAGEVAVPVLPNPPTGPGNVDEANALFSTPATDKDEFPSPWILPSLEADVGDARRIGNSDSGLTLWAVKQRDAGFCLIAFRDSSPDSPYIHCATVEEFETSGLSIRALRFTVRWDGESSSFTG